MPRSSRDEFSEETKRIAAERGAYICANPFCRGPTVGPHSDPRKSLKTGQACHIRAAARGGPRFDASQTSADRKSIENAIWLCSNCSDPVDKDEARFATELLLEWKREHEDWIRDGGIVPKLPRIEIQSMPGFTLPETPGSFAGKDFEGAREHRFEFENTSGTEIRDVEARVQLPEPIINSFGIECPIGRAVGWFAQRMQMQVIATGNGGVVRERPPLPTGIYRFQVDRLGRQKIVIGFVTSMRVLQEHDLPDELSPSFMTESDARDLATYIKGGMQYEYRGAILTRPFFAPISFDRERRQISVVEVRSDFGTWRPIAVDMFS